MKKLFAVLLALTVVLSMTACGEKKSSTNNKAEATSGEQKTPAGDNEEATTVEPGTSAGDNTEATTAAQGDSSLDLSKYPADFSEWTAKDVIEYFAEAVDFPSDCEVWHQDHATYWAGLPIYECSGVWNDEGTIYLDASTFNPDSPDTTPEEVEEVMNTIREDKNHEYVTDDIFMNPASHMIGHVAISYEYTLDDDVYNAIEKAYNELVDALGLTPDF